MGLLISYLNISSISLIYLKYPFNKRDIQYQTYCKTSSGGLAIYIFSSLLKTVRYLHDEKIFSDSLAHCCGNLNCDEENYYQTSRKAFSKAGEKRQHLSMSYQRDGIVKEGHNYFCVSYSHRTKNSQQIRKFLYIFIH